MPNNVMCSVHPLYWYNTVSCLAEVCGGDELSRAVHLVPQRNLFLRDVPQPDLAVQRPANNNGRNNKNINYSYMDVIFFWLDSELHYYRSALNSKLKGSYLMKNLSLRGWKPMAVTKSMCWNTQRHSFREMCQSRTVCASKLLYRKDFLYAKLDNLLNYGPSILQVS